MSFGRLFHNLTTCGKKEKVYDLVIPNNGLNSMSMQRWQIGRISLQTCFVCVANEAVKHIQLCNQMPGIKSLHT